MTCALSTCSRADDTPASYSEQYQDHYTTLSIFRVSNETVTTDEFLRGVKEVQDEIFKEWEVSPEKARLSSNSIDAGFKVRYQVPRLH